MPDPTKNTAMTRDAPSAPMQWLSKRGLLEGRCLDSGCGRGFDAKHFGMAGWDPNWMPWRMWGKWDTITCIYVLNVVPEWEVESVVARVRALLSPRGMAYFAVRRDLSAEEVAGVEGVVQRIVRLDPRWAKLIVETESFAVYAAEPASVQS